MWSTPPAPNMFQLTPGFEKSPLPKPHHRTTSFFASSQHLPARWGHHTSSQREPLRAGNSSILCSSPTSLSFAGFLEIPLGSVWVFANSLSPGFSFSPPSFPLRRKGIARPAGLAHSEKDKLSFQSPQVSFLGSARGKRSPDCAPALPELLLALGTQCSQLEKGGKTQKPAKQRSLWDGAVGEDKRWC